MIEEFGIPYEDHLIFDKNYDYTQINSKINVSFKSNFTSYGELPVNVVFRFRILDNSDIIYFQDKNISIHDNGDLSFDLVFKIYRFNFIY